MGKQVEAIRIVGTVKWFNDRKGFGFIVPDDRAATGHKDVFVHYSDISVKGKRKTLAEGQSVEFTLSQDSKGIHAKEVEILS